MWHRCAIYGTDRPNVHDQDNSRKKTTAKNSHNDVTVNARWLLAKKDMLPLLMSALGVDMKRMMTWVLLLEGLASAGIQMLAIRQSVAWVGSSVLSASIVIAAFLMALAVGYARGGRTTRNHRKVLIQNLTLAIVILGICFSRLFVDSFYGLLDQTTRGLGPVLNNPLLHLGVFSVCVMGPLVYLLAQTIPLALHESQAETKSQAAGDATAISTIGNVAGCLFTALVLLYFFGSGAAVFINCVLLAVCLFILLVSQGAERQKTPVLITVLVLSVSFAINVRLGNDMFQASNAYADTTVHDHSDGRIMTINRSAASFIGDSERQGWPYIEASKKVLFSESMAGKRILVLGAGGFTLTASDDIPADVDVTFVDVDPDLQRVAEEHFLKQPIKGQFVVSDARAFLLRAEGHYDAIMLDVFSNASTIPMHLTTAEFFELLASKLTSNDGLFIANLIADPTLSNRYSQRMDQTIRSGFSRCVTDIVQGYSNNESNLLYFCRKPSNDDTYSVVSPYRDDNVSIGFDSYLASLKHRAGAN